MPLVIDDGNPVGRFISGMLAALRENEARGVKPPLERRKLRTVTAECHQRGSSRFLAQLEERLKEAGIYTEPPLTDSSVRLDDWVLFSTGPFPPDSAFFPKEKDLQRFVEACLGNGVFRNLELFRSPGRTSGREFRLPDGHRIDLLCQERSKSGVGALVAIELKRNHERGTLEQMVGYLEALKQLYPSRHVRGIIISGREDQVAAALLKDVTGYDIGWLCYHVKFDRLFATS
jgi:Endonuclease NucS C-terminal domain